jgi:hypothetical protein
MRQWIIPALAAGVTGLAAAFFPAGPAQAHNVYQGDDYAVHSYDGSVFDICDAENDGHKVWAGYYYNGSNAYQTAEVIYGSDTSGIDCTRYSFPSGYYLTNLRVVEDNPDSGTNYYGAWHGYPVAGN